MTLLVALVIYAAAGLAHHAHNAAFLHHYPHMPAWLSPLAVYAGWGTATAVGALGYLLFRWRRPFAGLALLALYACYGLDSLAHYALAPISAHTLGMNATIWIELIAAAGLLATCARAAWKTWSVPVSSSGRPSP